MKLSHSFVAALAAAGLLLASTAAQAVYDTGIFFGGNVGYVNLSDESGTTGSQFSQPGFAGSVTVDDSDLGWKVFAGYSFTDFFGIEVGYTDLGEAELNLTATAPVAATQKATRGIKGYNVSAVARWPLMEKFELMAKFGGFFWDSDFNSTITTGGTTINASIDDDGTDMTAGLGVKVKLTEHVGVRAEWDRYIDVSDAESDIDLFSMGIEFTY